MKTRISSEQVDARQTLTPAILLMAEKRLAETLGLVETTAQNCRDSGELFNTLAAELNSENERRAFLSILSQ